jgi:peroxiredoxin Q/BCP
LYYRHLHNISPINSIVYLICFCVSFIFPPFVYISSAFQRNLPEFKNLKADIIGVSVDSVDKHLDFSKSYGLGFTLLSDKGGEVSKKYGSLLDLGFIGKFSNRQTYIISPDLKIEAVFTDVESKLSKHSEEVLTKLKSLSS